MFLADKIEALNAKIGLKALGSKGYYNFIEMLFDVIFMFGLVYRSVDRSPLIFFSQLFTCLIAFYCK